LSTEVESVETVLFVALSELLIWLTDELILPTVLFVALSELLIWLTDELTVASELLTPLSELLKVCVVESAVDALVFALLAVETAELIELL